MKFVNCFNKISLIIFLISLCASYSKSHNRNNTLSKKPSAYSEEEAKFLVKFSKNANCFKLPLDKENCGEYCLSADEKHKLFYVFHTDRLNTYSYNFMIHYYDASKKIVISFGGPSLKKHPLYIEDIYSHGFTKKGKTLKGASIEKEYSFVYFQKIRNTLHEKIKKIHDSGRKDYTFLFNGHSVGGSMATLAALDASINNVIKEQNLKVYTYGSMRIGDNTFSDLVKKNVNLFRIVKQTDYIVRTPTCSYIEGLSSWKCLPRTLLTNFYSYVFYSNSIISYPLLLVRTQQFVHLYIQRPTYFITHYMTSFFEKRQQIISKGFATVKVVEVPTKANDPANTQAYKEGKDEKALAEKVKDDPEHLKKAEELKKNVTKGEHDKKDLIAQKEKNERKETTVNTSVEAKKSNETEKVKESEKVKENEIVKKNDKTEFEKNIEKAINNNKVEKTEEKKADKKLLEHKKEEEKIKAKLKTKKNKKINDENDEREDPNKHLQKTLSPVQRSNEKHENLPHKKEAKAKKNSNKKQNKNNTSLQHQINTIKRQINKLESHKKTPQIEKQINNLRKTLSKLEEELKGDASSFLEVFSTRMRMRSKAKSTSRSKQILLYKQYFPVFKSLQFYNEDIYYLQPLGQVYYYTDNFSSHVVCYFCRKVVSVVPETITYEAHSSYFGETFDC